TLTSTGTLSLTGDGAFSWVQKTPFVQTVSLKDGVFTIRYEDEAPEVMKAETHPAVLSAARLLTSVMRLDAAALQDAFDFTLVGGEKPADAWTITLRARDEALGRILGTVTLKGSEYVESIRMSPSNDNVTDMILSNVRIVKGA
ncbi:MAG: LolA family protein, partial [Sutterella wadsworthensis]